jgi:hypothetical protein
MKINVSCLQQLYYASCFATERAPHLLNVKVTLAKHWTTDRLPSSQLKIVEIHENIYTKSVCMLCSVNKFRVSIR